MESPPQNPKSLSTENENPPETPTCWSELPKNVLRLIAYKAVDCDVDRSRIRGICKSWRALLPEDQLPRLIPEAIPPLKPGLSIHRSQFHLFYPIHPPAYDSRGLQGRWLVRSMVRSRDDPNRRSVCSPLNRTDRYFESNPTVKGELSLLSCRSLELASVFHITIGDDCEKELSVKVDGGWFNSDSGTREFALVAILKNGSLHFWKLGDERWTSMQGTDADDIAFDRGNFYAFNRDDWRLSAFHFSRGPTLLKSLPGPDILAPNSTPSEKYYAVEVNGTRYVVLGEDLVSCEGNLYLIIEGTIPIDKYYTLFVFLLNEEGEVWERVQTFGDRILFIGPDVCFSLSSSNLPQWEPNSVCLFNREMGLLRFTEYGSSSKPEFAKPLKFFSCLQYWRYFRRYHLGNLTLSELVFGLFFPPPSWLKWGYTSPDGVKVEVRLDLMNFSKKFSESSSRVVFLPDSEEEGEEDGGGKNNEEEN